jgi:hypothetical protein
MLGRETVALIMHRTGDEQEEREQEQQGKKQGSSGHGSAP